MGNLDISPSFKTQFDLADPGVFEKFLHDLREYLKTKLTLVGTEPVEEYSCGHPYHHYSDRGWKPFKNLEQFCKDRGYIWEVAWSVIESRLGKEIVCECQILTDEDALRRARLRGFGFDPDQPGI